MSEFELCSETTKKIESYVPETRRSGFHPFKRLEFRATFTQSVGEPETFAKTLDAKLGANMFAIRQKKKKKELQTMKAGMWARSLWKE